IGLVLLILSGPCELFPALVWKYVIDRIATHRPVMPLFHYFFSFNGRLTSPFALLASALSWLFAVYLLGELFQTIQQNLMNRVAQKFIYQLRNRVYHKLQSQ